MKLPISILLIATYLVPGKARHPRSRYYYSNVSTEPITYQYQSQSQVISGREANDNNAVNIDSSINKPHPSLSCLLFNDDGCQLSCYLLCNIHGCQSEAFCRNRYYCECNEMYFVNNNVLTANQFRDLTFQDLWNYKFAPSRLSSAVQKRILQDNEMYQFILPLLQNPHKNGDDVKNALLQRYPELQTAQYLQTIEHGVKSTLYSNDNGLSIEQYIQDMIHDMKNDIYNRIAHTRYMRRIINLIKNIADQDDLQYILKQLFLTGNQRLYERIRRYLIKKGYYFESEFPDGGSRKRRKCRRKRKQRKKGCKCKNAEYEIFGYNNNYPYSDYNAWFDEKEEDAKLMLIIELLNTSKTDGQFPNTAQGQQISPSQQTIDAPAEDEYKTPPQQSHNIVIEKTDQQAPQQQALPPQQIIYVDKTAQQPSQELHMNDAVAEVEYNTPPQQSHILVIEEAGQQAPQPQVSPSPQQQQQQQQQQIYVHKMVQQPSQEVQVSHTNSVLQQPTILPPPPPQHIPYTSKITQQQQQQHLPPLPPEVSQIETMMSSPSPQQLPTHNQQQQTIYMNEIMQEQPLSPSQPPLSPQPSPHHQQQITYIQKIMHQPPSPPQITFEEKIQPPRPPSPTQHEQISYVEMMEHLPPQQHQISYTKLIQPTNSLPSQKNEVIEISHVPSFEQTKQNIVIQNPQQPTITHVQQMFETSESPITKETEINQHLPPPPKILKDKKAQSFDTTPPVANVEDNSSDEVQVEELFLKNSPLTSDQQQTIIEKSLKPEVSKSSPSITDIPPEFLVQNSNIETSPSPYIDDSEPVILETYDIPDSTSTTTSIWMKNKPSPMFSETVQSKMQPTEILLNSQTPGGYRTSYTTIDTKKQPESYAYYLFNGDGDIGEPKTEQVQSSQWIQNQSVNQEDIIITPPPPQPQPQPAIIKQTKGKKFYSFLMDDSGNIIKSANYHYPGETQYSQVIHNSSPTHYAEESTIFEKLDRQNLLNAVKEKASDTVIIDDINDIHNLPTPDDNLLNNEEANISNLVSSDTQNPTTVEKVATDYMPGSNSAIFYNHQQSEHGNDMPQDHTVGSTSYTYNSVGTTHTSSSPTKSYQNDNSQIQTDDYVALDYDISKSTAQQNHQWIDIEVENDNLDASGDSVLIELDTDEEANNDIIYQTHKEDENNLDPQIARVTSNLNSNSVTTQTQTSFSKSSTTKNELVEEAEIREEHDEDVSIDITCDDPLNPEDDLMNF